MYIYIFLFVLLFCSNLYLNAFVFYFCPHQASLYIYTVFSYTFLVLLLFVWLITFYIVNALFILFV